MCYCAALLSTRLSRCCSEKVQELSYEINSAFSLLIIPGFSMNAEAIKVKESYLPSLLVCPENYTTLTLIPCTFCLFLSLYLLTKTFPVFIGLTFPIFYLGLVLAVTLFLHHFSFFFFFIYIVVVFAIHYESTMDLHVFPIPMPPPASLPTPSLWVFPVYQPRALVSCIQPGQDGVR